MKKKRKAFTLIELLAVIIVLAIIALIAMPIIFNVIENAKVKSLENSAYGVVDAVRLQYMENLMNSEDGIVPLRGNVTDLTLSGEHPTGGRWEIVNDANAEDGRGIKIEGVTFASMEGYVCNSVIENGELTGAVACTKQELEPQEDGIVFEVEDGAINENGWANQEFDITVTANGASNLKLCWAYDDECSPEIPAGYQCEEINIYDYVMNEAACVPFAVNFGFSQAEAEFYCKDTDKTAVNMAEGVGVTAQTLVDAGIISNLEIIGKTNKCSNSSSGDVKTIFDVQTNTLSSNPALNLFKNGNNYICAVAEGLQSKCEIYKYDTVTPTLTVKGENQIVNFGESNGISTLFNTPTYGQSDGNIVCEDSNNNEITNTSSLVVGFHTLTCNAVGNNGLSSRDVTLDIVAKENSEPNEPDLFSNMIPVVYNSTDSMWEYADVNTEWYNYEEKEWANAVVLKSNPSTTYSVGDSIAMSDIAQMYVWIPRYKYIIFNANNGIVDEQLIYVTFEEGTATTGTVRCHDAINQTDSEGNAISEICTDSTQANNVVVDGRSTYTHPAFCLGRKDSDGSCDGTELTGIWVGKFETSGSASAANLAILPNVNPLVNQTISTFFTTMSGVANAFNLKDENQILADSHMIKNMEWGAVAYLKQSEYGLGITDIALNNYLVGYDYDYGFDEDYETITGCGTGERVITDSMAYPNSYTCEEYNTVKGMAASTTGNIYGVYDMSGGAYEYVMGNMVDSNGIFYPRNAGTFSPDAKHYDAYTYNTSSTTHGRGKLGDATKETLKSFDDSPYSHPGWYGDQKGLPNSTKPWFVRGGVVYNGGVAGIFGFMSEYGDNESSSRLVLTRP